MSSKGMLADVLRLLPLVTFLRSLVAPAVALGAAPVHAEHRVGASSDETVILVGDSDAFRPDACLGRIPGDRAPGGTDLLAPTATRMTGPPRPNDIGASSA